MLVGKKVYILCNTETRTRTLMQISNGDNAIRHPALQTLQDILQTNRGPAEGMPGMGAWKLSRFLTRKHAYIKLCIYLISSN